MALNTVAHTIGAAGVGAQASKLFGDSSLGIVSALLTILILVLSEIIPKQLEQFIGKLIQTHLLSHSIYVDFNLSFSGIVNKDNTVICKEKNKIISREELAALANIGYSEGVFSKQENRIIQNILNLKK